MFFRFVALLLVVTAVSIGKISLEKRSLLCKQLISDHHFQLDELNERRARLFLATQQLSGPSRLYAESIRDSQTERRHASQDVVPPLLEWRIRQDSEGH